MVRVDSHRCPRVCHVHLSRDFPVPDFDFSTRLSSCPRHVMVSRPSSVTLNITFLAYHSSLSSGIDHRHWCITLDIPLLLLISSLVRTASPPTHRFNADRRVPQVSVASLPTDGEKHTTITRLHIHQPCRARLFLHSQPPMLLLPSEVWLSLSQLDLQLDEHMGVGDGNHRLNSIPMHPHWLLSLPHPTQHDHLTPQRPQSLHRKHY